MVAVAGEGNWVWGFSGGRGQSVLENVSEASWDSPAEVSTGEFGPCILFPTPWLCVGCSPYLLDPHIRGEGLFDFFL